MGNNMSRSLNAKRWKRASGFTLVELLVVIAIMGIVAGMVLGLAGVAGAGERRKKVLAQRDQLITAIEAYKKQHGYYPPDNTNTCLAPQLYYELRGGTLDPATKMISGSFPSISTNDYAKLFGHHGIANSKPKGAEEDGETKVTDFIIGLRSPQSTNITVGGVDAMFLTVGVEAAQGTDFKTNTWRYVSTNPTNNGAGNFDLWADVLIKGKTETIGNWNK
jgi:prepilin-type N-terminal cleavage/methylation domain-containing protein